MWDAWEFSPELIASGQLSPTMHTSFRDGTKAAIEMAAVANCAGLRPGRRRPELPAGVESDLASICRPVADGGSSSAGRRWRWSRASTSPATGCRITSQEGVFVVVKAPNAYVRACFAEYAWKADDTHQYVALYRTQHFIGLELNISIASAAVRREPTGAPVGFAADVVAVAKKPLRAGDMLDGEGGFAVWGRLMPAELSLSHGALPIGLAHHVPLIRDVAEGDVVTWDDVDLDMSSQAVTIRKETEALAVAV